MALSSRAVAVLEEAVELSGGGGLVFPGTRASRPLGENTHTKLFRELGFDAVTHGFRRRVPIGSICPARGPYRAGFASA